MAVDYNSELIDRLYNEADARRATQIADEMVEINDPMFIYPIASAHIRFKKNVYSHYFISDLTNFDHPLAFEVLKPLIPNLPEKDLHSALGFLSERKYSDKDGLTHISKMFEKHVLTREDLSYYYLETYLDFFLSQGMLSGYFSALIEILKDPAHDGATRQMAWHYLLLTNKSDAAQRILDDYESIRATKVELIVTRELLVDSDEALESLKQFIQKNGSPAARELFIAAEKKAEIDSAAKALQTAKKYSNAELLAQISSLRSKLDILTTSDSRFGVALLKPFEKLYQQFEASKDQKQLVSDAIDLRACLQAISPVVDGHGLSIDEANKIIPNLSNFSGSLNRLHLYLSVKDVSVDDELFGLRPLNQALSKLAHPEQASAEDSLKALKKLKLEKHYTEGDWPKLNQGLLSAYRDALTRLITAVNVNRAR